jgi:hypothetical protein
MGADGNDNAGAICVFLNENKRISNFISLKTDSTEFKASWRKRKCQAPTRFSKSEIRSARGAFIFKASIVELKVIACIISK